MDIIKKPTFCWQKFWKESNIRFLSKKGKLQKDIILREISGKPLKVSKPEKWECWECRNKIH